MQQAQLTGQTDSPDRADSSVLLTIRDLDAAYPIGNDWRPVLTGIELTVRGGEFVAVIGPSGAGKSTLLDVIAGLQEPQAGEIRLDGVARSPADLLGRSSYMKQRDLLLPWRTVIENAALGLEAAGVNRAEARRLARERLPEFGLEEFAADYPSQLSGG